MKIIEIRMKWAMAESHPQKNETKGNNYFTIKKKKRGTRQRVGTKPKPQYDQNKRYETRR